MSALGNSFANTFGGKGKKGSKEQSTQTSSKQEPKKQEQQKPTTEQNIKAITAGKDDISYAYSQKIGDDALEAIGSKKLSPQLRSFVMDMIALDEELQNEVKALLEAEAGDPREVVKKFYDSSVEKPTKFYSSYDKAEADGVDPDNIRRGYCYVDEDKNVELITDPDLIKKLKEKEAKK